MSEQLRFEPDDVLQDVRAARPEFSDDALSPAGAPAQAVLDRALRVRRSARPRSAWRRASRGAPVAAAIGATVLVVAVAVLTLRGHTSTGGVGASGRGEILDRTGQVLSPGLSVRAGLEAYYHAELKRGDTLSTSLDAALERTGQQALRHAIALNPPARGGAFVALDPGNGQVYAMGSASDSATGAPGPVGGAFTPITALAALESGAWSAGQTYDDTGQFCIQGQCRHNAGRAVDGVLNVASALRVGSDDFFDNLGVRAAPRAALWRWAHALGLGRRTGIDLPDESAGTLPRPGATSDVPATARNINLAVGQGDAAQGAAQLTPLQLAVAYAALENGGPIVRPHLGLTIKRPDGSVLRTIDPPPARHLKLGGLGLAYVRDGMREASWQPGGTSADVFGKLPFYIYGETGSAQYPGRQNSAWYAGFIPAGNGVHPIVVVVTVEQGGFGDVAAVPVARQIFSQWILGVPGPWVAGTAQTL